MRGFRDLTIKAKLRALVLFSAVGLAAVLSLALWVLWQYRINGPAYHRISLRSAALAELTPAAFEVVEPYFALVELSTATDAAEIQRLQERFAEHERVFKDRETYWTDKLFDGPTKQALVQDVWPAGREFYRVAKAEYLPLLGKGDGTRLTQALREKVRPRYLDQRQAVQRAMGVALQANEREEADVAERVSFWLTTMIVMSVVSIVLIACAGWLVSREITQPTEALIQRVHAMASGASDLTARVDVQSRDEVGQLATGINAMIAKIQTIVQRVREASVQLLSTGSQIAAAARQQEQTVQALGSSTRRLPPPSTRSRRRAGSFQPR